MKFKICGDLDAPEWLLAEIATLSKLSSIRVRLLAANITSGAVDYEKMARLASGSVNEKDVRAAVAALHAIINNAARYEVDETTLARELEQLGLPKEHTDAICKLYEKDRRNIRARLVEGSLRLAREPPSTQFVATHALLLRRGTPNRMELTDCKVEYVLASSSGAEEGPQVHLTFARPDAAGGAGAGPSGASGGAGAPAGAGAGAGAWGSAGGRGAGAGTLTVRPVEKVTVCADKFNLLLYELKAAREVMQQVSQQQG